MSANARRDDRVNVAIDEKSCERLCQLPMRFLTSVMRVIII